MRKHSVSNQYNQIIIALLFVVGCNTTIFSQGVELNASVGYMLNGKINYYKGEADVFNNAVYGGILDIAITSRLNIEMGYSRCDTKVKFLEYSHLNTGTYKMSVEILHIGAMLELAYGDVKPFVALNFGATRFHLKDIDVTDSWRFSVAPALGTKIFFSDILGLRLQARLLLPMEFTDTKIFLDPDTEENPRTFGIPIVQADISAGIFVVLR